MSGTAESPKPAGQPTMLTGIDKPALASVLAMALIFGLGLGLTGPLLAILMERQGLSRSLIGLNTAMAAVALIVVSPLVPRFAAQLGVKRFLAICFLGAIVTILAFKATESLIVLWFPIRFAFNALLTGIFVIGENLVTRMATDRTRGLLLGLFTTMLAGGFAIGAALLAVMGSGGWAPFASAAVLMALALGVILAGPALLPVIERRRDGTLTRAYGALLSRFPLFIGASALFGLIEFGVFSLLPVYGLRSGLSEAQSALALTAVAAGNIAVPIAIGMIADRWGAEHMLTLLAILTAALAVMIPATLGVLALLYILLFALGGVAVGLYLVGLAGLIRHLPAEDVASANAIYIAAYGVGSLIGPLFGGIAMDLWDPHGLITVLAGACLVYLMARLIARDRAAARQD